MKIGISSTGEDLNADVDPRFGRCKYFLFVDTDTMDFETVSNESAMASGGAGVQTAQTVAKAGVKTCSLFQQRTLVNSRKEYILQAD